MEFILKAGDKPYEQTIEIFLRAAVLLLHKSILWSANDETSGAKITAGNERHLNCKNVFEHVPDDDVEAIFRSLQMMLN